jgi:hypothetical protein
VVRQPVAIELGSKAMAECVAEALADFGGELEEASGTWTVIVPQDDLAFDPFFDALEECLRGNGIHSVRLSVGDQKYVMEGVP